MGLSQVELREEGLVQLRLLAASPGWALYRTRLQRLRLTSEATKADVLRGRGEDSPQYVQGVADGLDIAVKELERYTSRLQSGDANLPPGSGSQEESHGQTGEGI